MVEREGPKWKQIVKELPGRTVSSVRNRWQRIEKGRKLREDNAELREDIAELREDNTALRGEIGRLKERLRQNGTLEDGDDVEVEEETTATTSIPQQDCLEADHSNVKSVPSVDQATNRLAGFGEIPGNRNALARKANPQPQSRTSGTTPEDASVEARVDEL